jgi:tetrahydromethanopterin S-methyltransferase subunit C
VSMVNARVKRLDPVAIVWLYITVLGVVLLLEGALLLVLDSTGAPVPISTSDTRHNALHVASGIALIGVSIVSRGGHRLRAVWASLLFGAFYIALGVLGLTVDHPFGLQLGPGENLFHFTVGPLAFLLGAWESGRRSCRRHSRHAP